MPAHQGETMTLQIGDSAPDFAAETTEGLIRFHDWIGGKWAVLFSHPKDFTPVCTTELGYMAKIKPEFDRRDVKIIGLSVDPVGSHARWAADIEATQGAAPNYPVIADSDFTVSKLYGMLPAARGQSGDITGAITELRQLLTDQQRVLGSGHPLTLTIRAHLTRWEELPAPQDRR